jgi:hypothetical protein
MSAPICSRSAEPPAEDYPIAEAEPSEVPAKYPPTEEFKADSESEAAQQTNGLSECKADGLL